MKCPKCGKYAIFKFAECLPMDHGDIYGENCFICQTCAHCWPAPSLVDYLNMVALEVSILKKEYLNETYMSKMRL